MQSRGMAPPMAPNGRSNVSQGGGYGNASSNASSRHEDSSSHRGSFNHNPRGSASNATPPSSQQSRVSLPSPALAQNKDTDILTHL
ncbi:unnamed protein product, partial [Cyprideis torosa]